MINVICYVLFCSLMLLFQQQEGHPVCKKPAAQVIKVLFLGRGGDFHNLEKKMCLWPYILCTKHQRGICVESVYKQAKLIFNSIQY